MIDRTGRLFFLLLILEATMVPSSVSALEVTSTAAGFAGTLTSNCESDANNFEIEVFYNSYQSCQRHGILEFDVGASSIAAVSSAIVTLRDGAVGNMEGFFFTVDLYGYDGDNQVTSADYNIGTYIGSATWSRYGLPEGIFAIDLTDYVNTQLALGTDVIGLNIRAPFESSHCCTTTFIYFDGATGDHPPTLSLQPVPLPAGLLLFGSALGAVVGCRRGRTTDVPR